MGVLDAATSVPQNASGEKMLTPIVHKGIGEVVEVVKGSAEHPDDTYWFQDVGWLNPAQVAEQDGKTFLATCSHDPTKK